MGEAAEDLINGSEMTNYDYTYHTNTELNYYEVSIVHRKTGNVHWSTSDIQANSKKDAQRQFRLKHAEVRKMYNHEYGLIIKRINL